MYVYMRYCVVDMACFYILEQKGEGILGKVVSKSIFANLLSQQQYCSIRIPSCFEINLFSLPPGWFHPPPPDPGPNAQPQALRCPNHGTATFHAGNRPVRTRQRLWAGGPSLPTPVVHTYDHVKCGFAGEACALWALHILL